MCGCLSHTPTGDKAGNPGMCPGWELNWRPFGLQAHAQSTELYQPGQFQKQFNKMLLLSLKKKGWTIPLAVRYMNRCPLRVGGQSTPSKDSVSVSAHRQDKKESKRELIRQSFLLRGNKHSTSFSLLTQCPSHNPPPPKKLSPTECLVSNHTKVTNRRKSWVSDHPNYST